MMVENGWIDAAMRRMTLFAGKRQTESAQVCMKVGEGFSLAFRKLLVSYLDHWYCYQCSSAKGVIFGRTTLPEFEYAQPNKTQWKYKYKDSCKDNSKKNKHMKIE